jgi:hypothetical protein
LALGDNKIYVQLIPTPCYAISELKLTLLSKPAITIPDVVPICENNTVTIDAGSGFDTYYGQLGDNFNISGQSGNYSVTVTNNTLLFLAPALRFRSTKIKHCHDNFCRYALGRIKIQ